ncbi:MAG: ankyrin repeat domain-containing protein, partial [Hyphomonadaceae bacterium]|nr:ankyrin repeat domain-containing protein [Hyphomonadaceae bacterium]
GMVTVLLNAGADVDVSDKRGWAPLHVAARYGRAGMVTVLLDAGADVNVRRKDDWTPLHFAAAWGTAETVAVLIKAGADPGAGTVQGKLPADLAKNNDKVKNHDVFQVLDAAR